MNIFDLIDYLDGDTIGWSLHVDEETDEASMMIVSVAPLTTERNEKLK